MQMPPGIRLARKPLPKYVVFDIIEVVGCSAKDVRDNIGWTPDGGTLIPLSKLGRDILWEFASMRELPIDKWGRMNRWKDGQIYEKVRTFRDIFK